MRIRSSRVSRIETPHLLIVGTMNRPDVVAMFKGVRARMTFLEYEDNWGVPLEPATYERYGEVTTWEQHRSADALLERLRPDRLAMISVGSREQVALRAAAGEHGLEVVHVEHGYRLPLQTRMSPALDATRNEYRSPGLRRHVFFLGSLARRRWRHRNALVRYAYGTVRDHSHRLLVSSADLRRADRYVSYSPECFEFHRKADRVPLPVADRTIYTGVPQFDCFHDEPAGVDPAAVLLVDHQLHNSGLLGWDAAFRHTWAERLFEVVCRQGKRTLYVKEHPGDRSRAWDTYEGRGVVRLRSVGELADRSRSTPVALGIMSTLQMPVIAQRHTAMVSLEIHPRKGPALSQRFVDAGVCEPVSSFAELSAALGRCDELHTRQVASKKSFTTQFLHRLDGRATQRLGDALVAFS
jgi:hypothetical protein